MNSDKYPRTPHLPLSNGGTGDDKRLSSTDHFIGKYVTITEKMDGSNLCMTCDDVFARSHNGPPSHKSFDLAKSYHAKIKYLIDPEVSVFGEWLFCVHSIEYNFLPGYFLIFGVRCDSTGFWHPWNLVCSMAKSLGFHTVPVLWSGLITSSGFLESIVDECKSKCDKESEGVVIRFSDGFFDKNFSRSIAKWVRSGHPKDPDEHWMYKPIIKQKLGDMQ